MFNHFQERINKARQEFPNFDRFVKERYDTPTPVGRELDQEPVCASPFPLRRYTWDDELKFVFPSEILDLLLQSLASVCHANRELHLLSIHHRLVCKTWKHWIETYFRTIELIYALERYPWGRNNMNTPALMNFPVEFGIPHLLPLRIPSYFENDDRIYLLARHLLFYGHFWILPIIKKELVLTNGLRKYGSMFTSAEFAELLRTIVIESSVKSYEALDWLLELHKKERFTGFHWKEFYTEIDRSATLTLRSQKTIQWYRHCCVAMLPYCSPAAKKLWRTKIAFDLEKVEQACLARK